MSVVHIITGADELAQREIENDINTHLQALTQLRRRFNSFARINRLPLELLTEILSFCQHWTWSMHLHDDDSKYGYIAKPLRWIVILNVCHYWREISLQTPRLWSQINLGFPEFARKCSIVRAKRHPLHLTVTGKRWGSPQTLFFNELALEINRIHSIDMSFYHYSSWRASNFNSVPSTTSPLISLRISSQSLPPSQLPMIFENGQFPEIRRVELIGTDGRVPLSLLGPTLTQLILSTNSYQAVEVVAFSHLLSQMSRLELLHLQGVSFQKLENKSSSSIITRTVPLPALRRLIVQPPHDAHRDYISFLENLRLPIQARIHLKFVWHIPGEDVSALCHAIMTLLHPYSFHSLVLYDLFDAFLIGLWEDTVKLNVPAGELDILYGIWLPLDLPARTVLWEELLHVLDLHLVEVLRIDNPFTSYGDLENSLYLLRTCQCLKYICLEGLSAHAWVRLLLERANEELDSTADDVVLRRLITPELKVIYFLDVVWRTNKDLENKELGGLMEDLIDVIQEREGTNRSLERVVIKRCLNMNGDDVECLQHKGATVEWDGTIAYHEDSEGEDL